MRVGVEILYETDRLPDKGRKDQEQEKEQVAGLHQRLVVDGRIEQNGEVYDIDVADSLAVMDKVQPVPDFDFGRSPYFVHAAGVLCRKNNNKFRFYGRCRFGSCLWNKESGLTGRFLYSNFPGQNRYFSFLTLFTRREMSSQASSPKVVPTTSMTLPAVMAPIVPHWRSERFSQSPARNPAA